jgi:hypothetical protein
MEILMNLAAAQRAAQRKAIERDAAQPIVAAYGGFAVPNCDEMDFDLAGAEVVAVYQPCGEAAYIH